MASNYSYLPLALSDASEIRIVKLYPGKFEDDIRCDLMHASLTSKDTSYITLSYTWGSPDTTKPILLDGEQFTVTENLESFFRHAQNIALAVVEHLPKSLRTSLPACATLRNHIVQSVLRDPDLPRDFPFNTGSELSRIIQPHVAKMGLVAEEKDESSSRQTSLDSCYLTFWIDSICINQRNQAEKSQQVGRMKDIYSHAQSTLIWLGDVGQSAEATSLAFSLMHDIQQQVQPFLNDRVQWKEVVDRITSEEFVLSGMRSFAGLEQILNRPWFRRVWIIQEVASAQGPVVVLLGFHPVDWYFLSHEVIPCFEYMIHISIYQGLGIIFRTAATGIRRLRNLAKEYVDTMPRGASSHDAGTSDDAAKRLYALLQGTCGFFEATDPRDVIYAILGLLGTSHTPWQLQPDYNASVGHVFHQSAIYLVRYIHRIDFLRFFNRGDGDFSNVPSWVPDWRNVDMGQVRADEGLAAANITHDGLGLELKGINLGSVATVVFPITIAAAILNTGIGGHEQPQGGEDGLPDVAVGFLTILRGMQKLKKLCLSQAQSAMPGCSLADFQNAWERFWQLSSGQCRPVWEMVEERQQFDLTELVGCPLSTCMVMLGHKFEDIAATGLAITSELELFTNHRTDSPINHDDVAVLVQGFKEILILRPTADNFTFVGLCEQYSFQANSNVYQEERFIVI